MKKKDKGPTTAAELMAELNADPEFVARRERADQELDARAEEWRRAEAPLLADLKEAGFAVESAWDLVNTSTPYPAALPILLKHLERAYPPVVREGIARALAVRQDARFAWDTLARLYRQEDTKHAKHGIAVALSAIADRDVIDEVIELVRDTRHGESRGFLLSALTRSRDPRARTAVTELADDPDLKEEIAVILRRRKRRER